MVLCFKTSAVSGFCCLSRWIAVERKREVIRVKARALNENKTWEKRVTAKLLDDRNSSRDGHGSRFPLPLDFLPSLPARLQNDIEKTEILSCNSLGIHSGHMVLSFESTLHLVRKREIRTRSIPRSEWLTNSSKEKRENTKRHTSLIRTRSSKEITSSDEVGRKKLLTWSVRVIQVFRVISTRPKW